VIELCKQRGFEVVERRIRPEELEGFSECFITGSAAEVTLVSEIGPYNFVTGNMGKVIMEDYSDAVRQQSKAAA
jgi:branched-chain amino acid aminotransferase